MYRSKFWRNGEWRSGVEERNRAHSESTGINRNGMDGGIEMKGEEREAGALALLDSFLLLPLLLNLRPIKFTITFATSVMWHLGSPSTLPWDTRIISAKPS